MIRELELGPRAPAIVHHSRAPVFIVGHARSGTTMLTRALRKYLRIGFGTESQFIARYYKLLCHYGDLSQMANQRRLIEDICGERWFERCARRFEGFRTTPEAILADVVDPTYSGVLDAIFGRLSKHLGTQRWGDKTPEYLYHLPMLKELFPEGRFIHMVRDGRDVALSGFEQPFGEKNVFAAAESWNLAMRKVDDFARRLPAGQFLEVRYEDFVSSPKNCIDRIILFLDVDDCDGALAEFIAESLRSELKAGNSEKWRTRMSAQQIRRFDNVAGEALARYGYSVSVEHPRAVGSLARFYWRCDDAVRRVMHPGYLQDSLYRARLKIHDGLRKLKPRPTAHQ